MNDQLRERVEEKHGPINEQDVPKTPKELQKLAREDPDRFNALYEAGRIDPAALGASKEKDR